MIVLMIERLNRDQLATAKLAVPSIALWSMKKGAPPDAFSSIIGAQTDSHWGGLRPAEENRK